MMRRLTSRPKPAWRVKFITSSAPFAPSSPTRNPNRIESKRAKLEEHSDGAIK
ncbi:unannotated protein [freshwater metagenome]|uniref:Unannotated protein n=1 Tax=freshwater metagenome TaxID=449393 RepID=A0A6J6D0Z2_9ZZZZ